MVARRITSLQHPIVKRLVRLRQEKSFRIEEKRAVISGYKLVHELSPVKVFITSDESVRISAEETILATPEIVQKITGLPSSDGIAAEVPLPDQADMRGKSSVLILDGLSDPGNVGTVLRSALGLGWEGAILTPHTADPFNDKAIRAAKGASFHLPLAILSWDQIRPLLKGFSVFIADIQGEALANISCKPPLALILGSESHGPSSDALQTPSSRRITIPMSGKTESLSVAAAGAILLYTLKEFV